MAKRGQGAGGDAPTRALVIGRIRRGHHLAPVVDEVQGLLQEAGVQVDRQLVWKKKQVRRATARAAKAGVDLVVAVGGDGTVLQVANGLAGTDVPLAIVPTGTGNLLAANLRVPHPPAEAIRVALTGRQRRIDVGRIDVDGKRRVFTVACGIGFDADVMERTDSAQKARWGRLAYLKSAILEGSKIRDAPHVITIDGDRTTIDAAQVMVANLGRLPPGLQVRGVRSNDGLLDVFVIRASGPLPALLAGWEAIRSTDDSVGELGDGGRIFRIKARTVRVETQPARRVEIDGSTIGRTPVTVSIRPAALTVMVPGRVPSRATAPG